MDIFNRSIFWALISLLLCENEMFSIADRNETFSTRRGKPTIKRTRRSFSSITEEYGPTYFRRAYRMNENSFWKLHGMLFPALCHSRDACPNGIIESHLKLSMSLRYFAGGDPLDIMISHGVSHSAIFDSVWTVVDAINTCDALEIKFPTCHDEQRRVARKFAQKSKANFKGCVGAIDGLLIWTEKPSVDDCFRAQVGPKKFFCGRKHKFGLNLQAICDADCRFMDVSLQFPASCSDYLAFICSPILKLLETPGFLAQGLHLFGDNAYVNKPYMATPFTKTQLKGEDRAARDAYNFYHSNVRITVERSFGQLVLRWGILRKPLHSNLGLQKTVALTLCLCRLHNFCIDEGEGIPMSNCAIDSAHLETNGAVQLDRHHRPAQLLNGSRHFDDVPASLRYERLDQSLRDLLPQARMVELVKVQNLVRPARSIRAGRGGLENYESL